MAEFRARDMNVERELARFMDDFLYKDGRFSKAERTDSIESQMNGSDICLSIPSLQLENIIVDEKGMTQYMDNPLPTFALELSFLNRGREITGWFVDDKKSTEYYLLLWPKAMDKWYAKYEDFIEVEYALVSKKSIRDYLESKGYSKEALIEKARNIRENNLEGAVDKCEEDFWFYNTTRLVEKPINIVIRKNVYKELALMTGIVRRPVN